MHLRIFDGEYRIKTDRDPDFARSVATYLSKKMVEASKQGGAWNREVLAVVAAMNITEELFDERERTRKLRRRIIELTERLRSALQRR